MSTIEQEIKQGSFQSEYIRLAVDILFSASWLNRIQNQVFKPHGVTYQQFNVMRIIKGQKGNPTSIRMIADRMIDKQSNASRLVDKLEEKKLIKKSVNEEDRRQSDIFLTPNGKELVDKLYDDLHIKIDENFKNLSIEEAEKCCFLLDKLRG